MAKTMVNIKVEVADEIFDVMDACERRIISTFNESYKLCWTLTCWPGRPTVTYEARYLKALFITMAYRRGVT
jgi:hypothetical protein